MNTSQKILTITQKLPKSLQILNKVYKKKNEFSLMKIKKKKTNINCTNAIYALYIYRIYIYEGMDNTHLKQSHIILWLKMSTWTFLFKDMIL